MPIVSVVAATILVGCLASVDATISRDDAVVTLDSLRSTIERTSSYAAIKNDAWQSELESAKSALVAPVTRYTLERMMRRIIAPIGDGHASISSSQRDSNETHLYLRCRLETLHSESNAPIVALWPDRPELVSSAAPFVIAIDGIDIATWINHSAREVAHGSPQLVRQRAARGLERISDWRSSVAPGQDSPAVSVTLADATGAHRTEVTLLLSQSRERSRVASVGKSRRLSEGVGYLRLARMDDDARREVATQLDSWKELTGLVIDVRGNGGGSRDAFVELARRIVPSESSFVANAARPLLVDGAIPEEVRQGLERRGLRPVDDPSWSPSQRATIDAWRATFKPELSLQDDRFGPWHVMALAGDKSVPHLDCPVMVLLDANCFSATDVFLSAVRELPNVTLLGQASSGGSGASRSHNLANGFEVRLSSMVSFRPDGVLLDGNGVPPDIAVIPNVTDLTDPSSDATLQRAISEIVAANALEKSRLGK